MLKFDLDEYLKELEHLVNIDSGSRVPGGAGRIADYFERRYQELGLHVTRRITNDFGAPLLEVRNRPETDRLDYLFVGHMDTVFPDGEAVRRPYRRDATMAYGPGVSDMKAGLLSTYYLVKSLLDDNIDASFCILMNSDEEISSVDSHVRISEVAARTDITFIMEPARKNGAYVKERKGLARYRVEVRGIAAHSGVAPQDGASAITEAAHIVLQLEALNNYEIGTSVNVGKISGGNTANVVCDYVECLVDTRFDDIRENQRIEAAFRALEASPKNPRTTVTITREGYRPPMRMTDRAQALIDLMAEKGTALGIKMEWVKTGGGSDGNFAAFAGSTVIDGAGPIGDGAHSTRENLTIASIEPRIHVLYDTITTLENQKKG